MKAKRAKKKRLGMDSLLPVGHADVMIEQVTGQAAEVESGQVVFLADVFPLLAGS